ncbi:hypothetical protein [Actinokineospora pegani]|uniref:hypothetical protein n=1 Tax=Actinokineospora pegani TaxID=2654637 RepID=UPI0012EAED7F|nr:hypothetical protein [Actinokineospora pegani]
MQEQDKWARRRERRRAEADTAPRPPRPVITAAVLALAAALAWFALASVFLILYLAAHALTTRPWRGPRIAATAITLLMWGFAVALLPDIADATVRGLVVIGIALSAAAQVLLYLPASNRFYRR